MSVIVSYSVDRLDGSGALKTFRYVVSKLQIHRNVTMVLCVGDHGIEWCDVG